MFTFTREEVIGMRNAIRTGCDYIIEAKDKAIRDGDDSKEDLCMADLTMLNDVQFHLYKLLNK